jgi:hypothetical protein
MDYNCISMDKVCTEMNCSSRVVLYCECSNPFTYMCKDHTGYHIVQKGCRDIKSLVFQPNPDESEHIHQNIRKVLKLISEVRSSIVQRTKQLFESIEKLEKEAILIVDYYEKRVENLYRNLRTAKEIYNEDYGIFKEIANSGIETFEFDIQKVLQEAKPLYNIEFRQSYINSTPKSSSLGFPPMIMPNSLPPQQTPLSFPSSMPPQRPFPLLPPQNDFGRPEEPISSRPAPRGYYAPQKNHLV